MQRHLISVENLSVERVDELVRGRVPLELGDDARHRVRRARKFLDDRIAGSDRPIYGINTGFGALHDRSIPAADLTRLQENLVMSHACGMGPVVPDDVVRSMLLLKIQGLCHGNSGVQEQTVQRLVDFYNADVLPVVHEQGSLGASGDLAPLAHLALPLIGRGRVRVAGEERSAAEVLREHDWQAIELQPKEGLALLNGTQFMSAYAVACIASARRLSRWAGLVAAMSIDAFDGRPEPFDERLQAIRRHRGQQAVAGALRGWLEGSEIITRDKQHVQDPYSFRCIPQVHGACEDALDYIETTICNEINAVTDNPTLFPDSGGILSGGNFHGQPLAFVLDHLCIVMAEIGSISERRTYKLIGGERGLPAFLVAESGLNSGFMIPQYAAASIVSQNKQLCTPASVDTIDSSAGQEDHVSMGANAATKAYAVLANVQRVLAIELLTAAQALDFRRPSKSSPIIESTHARFRQSVPFVARDTTMYELMQAAERFLDQPLES